MAVAAAVVDGHGMKADIIALGSKRQIFRGTRIMKFQLEWNTKRKMAKKLNAKLNTE